ncbi:MAG: Wzz/FepE/Etk N-terminal domain-containing protein [Roseiflexus sp.]|nr:Wzz/FepE/Etk N-terminal domain-containing protein [Roseiflexus sp.]MCS7290019.1 Wzz/FepE/Etk N-terminal domain-containing protein [Roseiflexus sp.]MDW8146436.1 Wzz/FepE/Etk N-terminal domain-containing protein [Roseiflexaceae bacterium]MDW8233569.1 Wzz/FepE/Etk N-terminal domain-containing protein [Roseiflexaceae bacterium]
MSLATFIRILIRNWWLVVLATALTVGSTALFVLLQKPVYQASTIVELKPSAVLEDPNQILNTINALTRRNVINTIARKATSMSMHEEVAKELGKPVEEVLSAQVRTITPPETNLIEVRTQHADPVFAALVANTVARKMVGQDYEKVISVEIIDQAVPPTTPIAPQPLRLLTLAVVFGLILGVAFALLEQALQSLRTGAGISGIDIGAAQMPPLSPVEAVVSPPAPSKDE